MASAGKSMPYPQPITRHHFRGKLPGDKREMLGNKTGACDAQPICISVPSSLSKAYSSWAEPRSRIHGLMVRDAAQGARLLTMRVQDLILRSVAKRCVSKDEATGLEMI